MTEMWNRPGPNIQFGIKANKPNLDQLTATDDRCMNERQKFLHATEFCGGLISMAIASLPCLIVVRPSKNRTVLIKSPKSTAMALNKPNDLVKVDSSILFILQGEKRD